MRKRGIRTLVCLLLAGSFIVMSQFAVVVGAMANQNGSSYGADTPENPLTDLVNFTKYANFPTDVGDGYTGFTQTLNDGKGNIWLLPHYSAPAIVKFNTTTHEMVKYDNWPADVTYKYFYGGVLDREGNIWLVPRGGQKCIVKFNTQTGAMESFVHTGQMTSYVGGTMDENGTIWMVPMGGHELQKINPATNSVTTVNLDVRDIPNYKGGTFPYVAIVSDHSGSLWLIPDMSTHVLKVNINDNSTQAFALSDVGVVTGQYTYNFSGGNYDGNGHIWLVPSYANGFVKVDIKTGHMTKYDNWPAGISGSDTSKFSGAAFDGRYLWAAPSQASQVIRVDTTDGSMRAYNQFSEANIYKPRNYFSGASFDGKDIYMVSNSKLELLKISPAVDFSLTKSTGERVFLPDTVTIEGKLTGLRPNGTTEGLRWFRVPVSEGTDYSKPGSFEEKLNRVAGEDKGEISNPTKRVQENTLCLETDKNATYWFEATFKDANGNAEKLIRSITVDNVFTRSKLVVKGVDQGDPSQVLYEESPYPGDYGVALDLDNTVLHKTEDFVVSQRDLGPSWTPTAPNAYKVTVDKVDLGERQFRYRVSGDNRSDEVDVRTLAYAETSKGSGDWQEIDKKLYDPNSTAAKVAAGSFYEGEAPAIKGYRVVKNQLTVNNIENVSMGHDVLKFYYEKIESDDPVTPDNPVTPDDPVKPDGPVKPDDPITPDEPVVPHNPVTGDSTSVLPWLLLLGGAGCLLLGYKRMTEK